LLALLGLALLLLGTMLGTATLESFELLRLAFSQRKLSLLALSLFGATFVSFALPCLGTTLLSFTLSGLGAPLLSFALAGLRAALSTFAFSGLGTTLLALAFPTLSRLALLALAFQALCSLRRLSLVTTGLPGALLLPLQTSELPFVLATLLGTPALSLGPPLARLTLDVSRVPARVPTSQTRRQSIQLHDAPGASGPPRALPALRPPAVVVIVVEEVIAVTHDRVAVEIRVEDQRSLPMHVAMPVSGGPRGWALRHDACGMLVNVVHATRRSESDP
jgi:hypothetical protein